MKKFSNLIKKAAGFGMLLTVTLSSLTAFAPVVRAQSAVETSNTLLAPFTPGNLVVYRVGNGTETLSNTGNTVFLDEFTPSGTLVQSIALPTTVSGANKQLIASGTATSEGLITRSADNRFLLVTGYARDLGGAGSLTSTEAAVVNRVVGRVDAGGAINTTTALTDAFSANNIRGAVSTNGTDIWAAGANGGVRYTTLGATTSTQINTGATPSPQTTNLRYLNIYDNQLYYSTGSGANPRIGAVGTGTPTAAGQNLNPLTGYSASGAPFGFVLADLTQTVPGVDTLYVADDSATGGIQKYSLVGGSWVTNGSIGAGADAYRGLTGAVNGTTVTLYSTRKGGSGTAGGGELVSIVDNTGYNVTITAAPTLLATAAASTAFRGVAFAPVNSTNPPQQRKTAIDFNADGKTDYAVTRDANGQKNWYTAIDGANIFLSTGWGAPSDRLVPADYDGDRKTDIAVWRGDATQAVFYILQSATSTVRVEPFGVGSDEPSVVGDYDGDGKDDVAVFRGNAANAPATWYYKPSGTPATNFIGVEWGQGLDLPVPGDYDGDLKYDFVVQRDTGGNGVFFLKKSSGGTEATAWGLGTDVTVPGDYDGDGKNDFCVTRADGNGTLSYFILERDGGFQIVNWGVVSDIRVPGDYNGDGKTDIAVWRSSTGSFYIRPAGTGGAADITFNWGASTDTPIAGFVVQ